MERDVNTASWLRSKHGSATEQSRYRETQSFTQGRHGPPAYADFESARRSGAGDGQPNLEMTEGEGSHHLPEMESQSDPSTLALPEVETRVVNSSSSRSGSPRRQSHVRSDVDLRPRASKGAGLDTSATEACDSGQTGVPSGVIDLERGFSADSQTVDASGGLSPSNLP
jgi:hypothetical protein